MALYPFLSKVILLNQVSMFIGQLSNLKHDIINSHDGRFQYLKEGTYTILPGMDITHKIDVTIESKIF